METVGDKENQEEILYGCFVVKVAKRLCLATVQESWNLEQRKKTTELLRTENSVMPVVFHNFKLRDFKVQ